MTRKCSKCGEPIRAKDLVWLDIVVERCARGCTAKTVADLIDGLVAQPGIAELTARHDRLRLAAARLLELDVDATAYEDGTPLTPDAEALRDAWRELKAAIEGK